MAHYPTSSYLINSWIVSTAQELMNEGICEDLLAYIFGNEILSYTKGSYVQERIFDTTEYRYPFDAILPYVKKLTEELPFDFILNHIGRACSYTSWIDLDTFVKRVEFNNYVMEKLRERSQLQHEYHPIDSKHIPHIATLSEIERLIAA